MDCRISDWFYDNITQSFDRESRASLTEQTAYLVCRKVDFRRLFGGPSCHARQYHCGLISRGRFIKITTLTSLPKDS